jgi:hypothetical protein
LGQQPHFDDMGVQVGGGPVGVQSCTQVYVGFGEVVAVLQDDAAVPAPHETFTVAAGSAMTRQLWPGAQKASFAPGQPSASQAQTDPFEVTRAHLSEQLALMLSWFVQPLQGTAALEKPHT